MDLDYETARLLQEEFRHEFLSPKEENLSDSILARQLQEQFEQEIETHDGKQTNLSDSLVARSLQDQFQQELATERPTGNLVYDSKNKNTHNTKSLVDHSWEVIDPTPDIHVLFMAFNTKFFWGKLDSVCVSWSTKMKRCAGVCSYQGRGGLCHITLSEPLLKLRPRKDLIETLLHEMIHAFLFVTCNNSDRDGHGPEFHKHMYRINKEAGTNITVYHDFHDEVELYLEHWWRCNGPCQKWKPYFGIVRRSMNRAPGPNDKWWGQHSRSCGGIFTKIKSPEPKSKKGKENKLGNDIRKYIPPRVKSTNSNNSPSTSTSSSHLVKSITKPSNSSANIHTLSKPDPGLPTSVTIPSTTNNIHGFSNLGNKTCGGQKGATKNASNTIVINKKPSTVTSDNNQKTGMKTSNDSTLITSKKNEINHDEAPVDYAIVRNHWINKFSDSTNPSASGVNSNSNKRSLVTIATIGKKPKLTDTYSQDSLNCETVACPICNIFYPIDELNEHLDNCLNKPKNSLKECIVCFKEIEEHQYQEHVNKCINNSDIVSDSIDDSIILIQDDSLDGNTVTCETCENTISLDDLDDHLKICKNRTKCPECGKSLHEESYDLHLTECLLKKFDEMDKRFKNKKGKQELVQKEEMVDCLACGKNILKSNLNCHLDECLNDVFKENKTDENDDKMYNCPFCMKLVPEVEMSDHIDVCLKIVDDDEAENNKSVFLTEID